MADSDTHYLLNRVAVKLHQLFLSGVDLREARRWIFEWNDDLTTMENLENIAAEDKAITTFTISGVIESESLNNRYRDYVKRDPEHPLKGIGEWGNLDEPDPALLEYDRVRFIEAFNYDTFTRFCDEEGINYKENDIVATLTIANQRPVVSIRDEIYTFKTLTSGTTLDIIVEICAHSHYNHPTTFDDLRRWLGNPNAYRAQKYFNQIYRDDSIFRKGNALSPFADIQSQSFTLHDKAILTPEQYSVIRQNSIK